MQPDKPPKSQSPHDDSKIDELMDDLSRTMDQLTAYPTRGFLDSQVERNADEPPEDLISPDDLFPGELELSE